MFVVKLQVLLHPSGFNLDSLYPSQPATKPATISVSSMFTYGCLCGKLMYIIKCIMCNMSAM